MIRATSITLTYATGLVSNLQTKELSREEFSNLWRAADALINQWSHLVAGQCDDVDFTITYEDGVKYSGTILIYSDRMMQERLDTHVRNHCEMFGGRAAPAGLDDAGYQEFLRLYALNCYEIGKEEKG